MEIKNYVLDEEIGRGAFGIVYRGHRHDSPEDRVAIKVLEDQGQMERQMVEPEMLAKLQHPHIVRLREYFVHQRRLIIVLDYISGGDLKTALEKGREFSQEEVRELLKSMASALAYAHHRNIVHRDIKMANIMIEERDGGLQFILTDFGIGRIEEGVQDRPNTGGTFLFMAPEQFRGRPTPQSDLWALGVVAYRLLSGKMPFVGDSLQELSRAILYTNPIAPSVVSGKLIDEKLDLLVTQLLEKSLNERVASAEELQRLLDSSGRHLFGSGSRILDTGGSLIQSMVVGKEGVTKESGMDSLVRRLQWQRYVAIGFAILFGVAIAFGSGVLAGSMMTLGIGLFCLSQTTWKRFYLRLLVVACIALVLSRVTISSPVKTTTTTTTSVDSANETQGDLPEKALEETKLASKKQSKSKESKEFDTNSVDPEMKVEVSFLGMLASIFSVFGKLSYPLFAIAIASHRRLSRKIANCSLLIQNPSSDPLYLQRMRKSIAERPSDILFRMKYVETLLALDQLEDVIVECQLILEIDPYNFNANLLLANGYVELGLFEEAAMVCRDYLEVSGYCFEFQMLLERCRNQGVIV